MATDTPLTEAQQQLLRSQVFDDLHPCALLHDFKVVLDYIGTKGIRSAGEYNLLPPSAIPKLDEKLNHPLHLPQKRPQLRSHPYLQGLHLLTRASGLVRVEESDGKARLVLDAEAIESWNSLNPTEQYFTLMEAWLLYAHPSMVGNDRPETEAFLDDCLRCWQRLLEHKTKRGLHAFHRCFDIDKELFQVALFDLFGLIDVEHPNRPEVLWSPTRVTLTPFGEALLAAVGDPHDPSFDEKLFGPLEEDETEDAPPDDQVSQDQDVPSEEEEEEVSLFVFNRLQSLFGSYFPQWQNSLTIPGIEQREGVFVFRVSFDEMWRLIAISSDATLDDLAAAILDSIKFDFDHLYEFTYRDRFGGTVRATHPGSRKGKSAAEVLIGELPLQPGETMPFLYDFGDDWQFDVKLERIDPPNRRMKKPRVLEKHGKAPEQYPGADW